ASAALAPACRAELFVKGDPDLHRQLSARANGKMRGRLSVADQHHIVGNPALAADGRKIAPDGAIGDQPMTLQLLREQAFGETCGRGFVQLVETGAREGFWIGLDDPRRAMRRVLVAMADEDAMLGL